MQAITTKYLGPTDYRGARIKATCQAGSVTVPFPYEDSDHDAAARALIAKLGWGGQWVSGGLPDGRGDAYVCLPGQWDGPATVNGKPVK